MLDIAIIGGGITGLTAGYELLKSGVTSFKIFESSNRVGGKIRTEKIQLDDNRSLLIEHGPDSFLSTRPEVLQLAQSLGISDQLIHPQNISHKFAIVRNGKLIAVPEGLKLMIPTSFWPFAFSPLISLSGKIGMAGDLIKRSGKEEDESVAEFITRRFGKEALDYLAEPLLAGIYGADPAFQSMAATFPHLWMMEKKQRSLILGMLKTIPKNSTPKAIFATFKNGMQTLIDALQEKLSDKIVLNAQIDNIESLQAKSVIITTNAASAAILLPKSQKLLARLTTTSSGNVYFGFKKEDISLPSKLSGFLIPRVEGSTINGASFTSQKFVNRASDDICLIRAFIGGKHVNDSLDNVLGSLQKYLKTNAQPIFSRALRMHNANPLYNVGHSKLLKEIEQSLPQGVYLAGSAYKGVGIPDCVKQGIETAKQIKIPPLEEGAFRGIQVSANS